MALTQAIELPARIANQLEVCHYCRLSNQAPHMELSQYFNEHQGEVSFTEEQASAFAKGIAGDYNPIHDPGSKRFCVPGDLLFCVLLHHYGVARVTSVQFSGMLSSQTRMRLPEAADGPVQISDTADKALLNLFLEGTRITDPLFVNSLSEAYVRFSGQTFPDILVPLMRSANAMINPDRPMVIYKDMLIELASDVTEVDGANITLKLADSDISVNGRKGAVRLGFDILLNQRSIGRGEKNMVLAGLREFEENAMQAVVAQYNEWRSSYTAA